MLILRVSCLYLNDEHVLWVGFPLCNHASFSPSYPTFHAMINPTPPCCIQHRSALPPTFTKKRKLFHLLNPFIHGLQVISPYSRHNPGPSGRKREREKERDGGGGAKRNDHIETNRGGDGESQRKRERGKETEKRRTMETNSNAVKSVEQQEHVNTLPSPTAFTRGGGADLSTIVNTCVQASSRPFTWRLKEAQHQRFMAPGEEKEVCY